MKTSLLWIRRELRLHDNEALVRAASQASRLLPVYILPERELQKASIGHPNTNDYQELPFEKSGAHRRAYLLQGPEIIQSQPQ
jgi:deoxyribodipyrimidine photo-lyase